MSGVYGSNESEEISPFLHILLQNSSSTASNHDFSFGGIKAESSSGIMFSHPGGLLIGASESVDPSVGSKGFLSSTSEGFDAPFSNAAPSRSTKRTRASEVHNLSEKRRRRRINEKLKALQTLIPNSSKTDKASMLDEAIEYLKQLQLQVQMLTMRNGISLHPGYSLSSLSAQELIDESAKTNANQQSHDHNIGIQNALDNNVGTSCTLPTFMPSTINDTSTGIISGSAPSTDNFCWFFDHLGSSKEMLP